VPVIKFLCVLSSMALTNWTGHILRRTCILTHLFEVKVEGRMYVMGGQERSKTPLDDLKEKREHWISKEEALGRSLWRRRCGSG
jgi:hypothetical protein